jgi:hypothetical protein
MSTTPGGATPRQPRRSRPPKPEAEKRQNKLTLNLTEHMLTELQEEAERERRSVNDFIILAIERATGIKEIPEREIPEEGEQP